MVRMVARKLNEVPCRQATRSRLGAGWGAGWGGAETGGGTRLGGVQAESTRPELGHTQTLPDDAVPKRFDKTTSTTPPRTARPCSPAMSSYFNNLLTTTASRYNSLRQQLLSDETDGNTEDDSHISRVLRAYYTEKGRPFPQWLPPDPKAPQAAPAQMYSSSGRQYGQMAPPQMGRGTGGIGDLWDSPSQPAPPQQDPMSLRRAQGRGGGGLRAGNSLSPELQAPGRPLPSQRAGSYQSTSSLRMQDTPPQSAGTGTSAQDRLKARLWGSGKSQSAATSQTSSPPTSPANMRSPYERPAGGRAPYPDERSGGGYSGAGGGQQGGYNMSANSPWSGSDDPYAPAGAAYNNAPQQPGGRRVGLPSGPRMR